MKVVPISPSCRRTRLRQIDVCIDDGERFEFSFKVRIREAFVANLILDVMLDVNTTIFAEGPDRKLSAERQSQLRLANGVIEAAFDALGELGWGNSWYRTQHELDEFRCPTMFQETKSVLLEAIGQRIQ